MNIVPYRAKLPDLPLPEKRHGGAFQTVPWERYPHDPFQRRTAPE